MIIKSNFELITSAGGDSVALASLVKYTWELNKMINRLV